MGIGENMQTKCPICGTLVESRPEYEFGGDTGKPVWAEQDTDGNSLNGKYYEHTDYRCKLHLKEWQNKVIAILEHITTNGAMLTHELTQAARDALADIPRKH